jgi:hypothetical protein
MVQTQITLPDNVMSAIRAEAGQRGITANILLRIMLCETYTGMEKKTIRIPVENHAELLTFAKAKKFGDVEHFAVFAMEQYMTRYPLKNAAKGKIGESIAE